MNWIKAAIALVSILFAGCALLPLFLLEEEGDDSVVMFL